MKKLLTVLLAIVFTFGFVACGNQTASEESSDVEEVVEEAAGEVEEAADEATDEVEEAAEGVEDEVEETTESDTTAVSE